MCAGADPGFEPTCFFVTNICDIGAKGGQRYMHMLYFPVSGWLGTLESTFDVIVGEMEMVDGLAIREWDWFGPLTCTPLVKLSKDLC